MKLIVISPSETQEEETKIVTQLFEHGLETFHLRKMKDSTRSLKKYIEKIPKHFHHRIVIHTHHELAVKYALKGFHITRAHRRHRIRLWLKLRWLLMRNPGLIVTTSFRKLSSIYEEDARYRYVFLSPIFDSLSGKYQGGFSEQSLRAALAKTKNEVIARGGMDVTRIEKVKELGFSGMAFYSGIWKKKDPLQEFVAIVNRCSELSIKVE